MKITDKDVLEVTTRLNKFLDLAIENRIEEEFYRFLGFDMEKEKHREMFDYLLRGGATITGKRFYYDSFFNNKFSSTKEKLNIMTNIEKDKILKDSKDRWRFAKLKKNFKFSSKEYNNANKDDLLVYIYKIKSSKFGDLFAFKFLSTPNTTIMLTADEFIEIRDKRPIE